MTARPRLVLLCAAVLTVLLAAFGADTQDRLANGGHTARGTEAAHAADLLADRFGTGTADLVLLVRAARHGVDSAVARNEGIRLADRIARADGVTSVRAYWTAERGAGRGALRSADGTAALIAVDLAGADREAASTARELVPTVTGRHGALTVSATGPAQITVEAAETSRRDLLTAELIAAPLVLLILVVALRSWLAALLPVVIGLVAVVGTIALLRLLTYATPVSVFALNLASALGFGLAVDYGLFLVTRFREELSGGAGVQEAVARTSRTAGRTVVVSACTVALSMAALLVLPLPFLRSMAWAGVSVALLAAGAATTLVPPLLVLLGERIGRHGRADSPRWRTLARSVTRHPAAFGAGCAMLLVLLAVPFGHARFGLTDERTLPADAQAHATAQQIRDRFPAPAERNLTVIVPPSVTGESLARYERRIRGLPSVSRVTRTPTAVPGQHASERGTLLTVTGPPDPQSDAAQRLVGELRSLEAPGRALVTGRAAQLADTKEAVADRLPLAVGVAVVTTWVMLFLLTGSVLLPVKALLVGALSLTASFGVLVYVFQDGHLSDALGGFTVTGTLDLTMPPLMAAIAFGLAVDYEIFLLSRVREHWLRGYSNRAAVVEGVARTGRLISTAALTVAVVTGVLATSGLTVLKLLGTGLAVAVLIDATLVRGVLVPACLTLADRANWWAPGPLARLHRRIGVAECGGRTPEPGMLGVPPVRSNPTGPASADPLVPRAEPGHSETTSANRPPRGDPRRRTTVEG
ncbi:MMPL family transporter [Streptomyces sp. WMMC897]|uniref:MMPL family transporter n=1 Tax=Streptomyces sp. WMMC897 TaxID=3014782 RepID=UPI0022B7240D|nr:MMPL family transporter [Streptomyces sp. WMMC897]MCZ7416829.1 MMPL family transporter [Streptomyces sp. WMMC897]